MTDLKARAKMEQLRRDWMDEPCPNSEPFPNPLERDLSLMSYVYRTALEEAAKVAETSIYPLHTADAIRALMKGEP